MLYQKLKIIGAIAALLLGCERADAILFSGVAAGGGGGGNLPAALTVYNTGSTASGQLVTWAQPFAQGDVPSGSKVQVYKADGVTPITTQEDGCSTWLQDGSRKNCTLSIVQPDSITGSGSIPTKINAVAGSPNTTPNVTKANITGNTNFCLKTSDLLESNATSETGTWDLICLNTVLNSYNQYNGSTGYGSNPVGGWDIVATGPNRYGIHAFEYAKRESDGAIHKWLRTDMWIDFWGSGSSPCPCSMTWNVSEPNTFGPISGGTVGPSSEGGYVFSAQFMAGSTTLKNFGGASGDQTLTLSSADFNTTTGIVTFPGGNWTERTGGVFPVIFSSTGSLPTGLVAATPYWIYADGVTPDAYPLAPFQCAAAANGCSLFIIPGSPSQNIALQPGNYVSVPNPNNDQPLYVKFCTTSACTASSADTAIAASTTSLLPVGSGNTYMAYYTTSTEGGGSSVVPIQGFSTAGSGTITATFALQVTPWAASGLLMDTKANRLWVDSSGATLTTAPAILVGHDFAYLTQKTKAVPPYIVNLAGNLLAYPTPILTYYPGAYLWPLDLNTTGDSVGDERIGYLNHTAIYSIAQPSDQNAAIQSAVLAASWSRTHQYHQDETVGLPVTFNNGVNGTGTAYPTMGAVQVNQRTYPYSTSPWLVPNFGGAGIVNQDPIQERYGDWIDSSHLVLPQQGVFFKTGQPEWEDQMLQEANASIGNFQGTTATVGPNTYYRPILSGNTVTRGAGWLGRALDQAYWFAPATSPVAPYLKDLDKGDGDYALDYALNATTANEQSLGYYPPDISEYALQNDYQWWMDDFMWLHVSMDAWRNEFSSYNTYATTYINKQIIGRMDNSLAGPQGPGCVYAGPARDLIPYAGNVVSDANIQTTWASFYSNIASFSGTMSPWGSWSGCPSSGLIPDGFGGSYGSFGNAPVSLITDAATSAAMGAVLGIPHAATIYSTIRTAQYGSTCVTCGPPPLSFLDYINEGTPGSYLEFAIGPLGAVN